LFAQVSDKVPLGWARLLIRKSAAILYEIIRTDPDEAINTDLDFNRDEFTNLLGVSLDSIWKD